MLELSTLPYETPRSIEATPIDFGSLPLPGTRDCAAHAARYSYANMLYHHAVELRWVEQGIAFTQPLAHFRC